MDSQLIIGWLLGFALFLILLLLLQHSALNHAEEQAARFERLFDSSLEDLQRMGALMREIRADLLDPPHPEAINSNPAAIRAAIATVTPSWPVTWCRWTGAGICDCECRDTCSRGWSEDNRPGPL